MNKDGYRKVLDAVETWPAERLITGAFREGDARCALGCACPDEILEIAEYHSSFEPVRRYLGLDAAAMRNVIAVNDHPWNSAAERKTALLDYLRQWIAE